MLTVLSDMVRNIVVLIILVTILELILPRKEFRPYVDMVVGLVLMLMLLSPLRSLLRLPAYFGPVPEMVGSMSQREIDDRQELLEQVNRDLTLNRYGELIREKVEAVLIAEGYETDSFSLALEEDTNHPEFGFPESITVKVRRKKASDGQSERVEKIRIELGQASNAATVVERSRDLEKKVAEALEISWEKIVVNVLKDDV